MASASFYLSLDWRCFVLFQIQGLLYEARPIWAARWAACLWTPQRYKIDLQTFCSCSAFEVLRKLCEIAVALIRSSVVVQI